MTAPHPDPAAGMASRRIERIDELIRRLRDYRRAQAASEQAADRASALTARRGPRGGAATTRQARWESAAEDRDRKQAAAAETACDLFNLRAVE